ncbi:Fibrillin-2 [Exaiptasia diaphana]|nr:Fibrillin-2 [Exaiptasia diaphana]
MRKGICYLRTRGNDTCLNPIDEVYRGVCCCTIGKAWNDCTFCPKQGTAEYKRICPGGPGFIPNPNTTVIVDVDECKELPGICSEGRCLNSLGSFSCICPAGQKHDLKTGRCVDIDECREYPYICGVDGKCINTPGGHNCICPPNQILDQETKLCIDRGKSLCFHDVQIGASPVCKNSFSVNITRHECCCTIGKAYLKKDECRRCPPEDSPLHSVLCRRVIPPITQIKDRTPFYTPTTPIALDHTTGFLTLEPDGTPTDSQVKPTTAAPTTDDFMPTTPGFVKVIDECKLIPELCLYGRCIDQYVGFRCECPRGYRVDKKGIACVDVDECKLNPCKNGRCKNTFGSFVCICPNGYNLDSTGLICEDMDECGTPGYCDNGQCKNMDGTFICQCNEGFQLTPNKRTCIDINECVAGRGICGNGSCINTQGSYQCQCYDGFKLNAGGFCRDIDECATDSSICQNGLCFNTEGSFNCKCSIGYTLTPNRRNCRDVNECTEIPNYCKNGRCTNTIGGARCECVAGYRLSPDGTACIDLNECDANPNYCEPGGRCANTQGSYRCICDKGYVQSDDGTSCADIRKNFCFNTVDENGCTKPRDTLVTKSACCCTKGQGWGDPCELCPQPDSKGGNTHAKRNSPKLVSQVD